MAKTESKTLFYDRSSKTKISTGGDGSADVAVGSTKVSIDKGGVINIENLTSIGIRHLPHLRSYSLVHDGDLVTHRFEFLDGGTGELSYRLPGKIEVLRATGCAITANPDGSVVFSQRPTNLPAPAEGEALH